MTELFILAVLELMQSSHEFVTEFNSAKRFWIKS